MKGTVENIMKHPGTPLVSVIIPVYNTEDYLRQCLDSAVNQTLKDIEIICINDGSTDHSPAILEEYQAKDPRVVIISQDNRGLSAARNCGMIKARGKYVYFLDSDDYVDSETLKRSTELAEKNDLDAVVFGFEQFADSDELLKIHPCMVNIFSGSERVYTGAEYMSAAKDGGAYASRVWTAVWRRPFLEKNGIRFVEGILHEDMLFSFQAYMAADRVMAIPERLYHYRARPDSICTKPISAKNVIGSFECAKGVLKYALEGGFGGFGRGTHKSHTAGRDGERTVPTNDIPLSGRQAAGGTRRSTGGERKTAENARTVSGRDRQAGEDARGDAESGGQVGKGTGGEAERDGRFTGSIAQAAEGDGAPAGRNRENICIVDLPPRSCCYLAAAEGSRWRAPVQREEPTEPYDMIILFEKTEQKM